jgi:hypothetical protein
MLMPSVTLRIFVYSSLGSIFEPPSLILMNPPNEAVSGAI